MSAPDRKVSILLVDDEPTVLAISRRMLEQGGYEVYEAAGIKEALEVLSEVNEIGLVVSDVRMPQNGWGLAEQLARRQPPIPILFISGFGWSLPNVTNITGVGSLLAKPFTEKQLLESVHAVLVH
jgi:CheY-like chemotaxis protein